ncbi:MAG: flagellar protein FlaG [Nitrospira defluvii]|nr:flagellar protein FlaG [Nitrospira defluvii]
MVPDVTIHKDLIAATTHASQNTPQHPAVRSVEGQKPEPQSSESDVNKQELDQALTRVREVFQKADSRVEFSIDPDLDRVIVKILDGESGTVIRQIPQQEVIELAKRLETPTGLLLHHKV